MLNVYTQQHARLRRFIERRLTQGRKQDADDVCQETWLRFYAKYDDHMARYDNPAKVLFPIARCRVAEYWRQRGRTSCEAPVEDDNLSRLADALVCAPSGASAFEGAVRRIDVERALARLTERQRETLHLRYLDDLAVGEIAPLMGVSENTVKKLRRVACEKLQKSAQLDSYRPGVSSEEVDE